MVATLEWTSIVERVLGGEVLPRDEAAAILALPDERLPELLRAALPCAKRITASA